MNTETTGKPGTGNDAAVQALDATAGKMLEQLAKQFRQQLDKIARAAGKKRELAQLKCTESIQRADKALQKFKDKQADALQKAEQRRQDWLVRAEKRERERLADINAETKTKTDSLMKLVPDPVRPLLEDK